MLVALHSTNTTEWLAIPADDPTSAPRVVLPRHEGREYAVDHLTPTGTDGPGWFVVITNEDAQDFRIIAAPDEDLGTARQWREIVPHRPGVRVEDVDAFSDILVLSERAEAETSVRVLPLAAGPDPWAVDLLAAELAGALHREPVVDLAGHESRTGADLPPIRPHLHGHPVLGRADTPRHAAGDPAQAGAGRWATSTRAGTPPAGCGPRHPTAPGCPSRWCTRRNSPCPPPVSSTGTAPTSTPSTRRSPRTGSRCSTAAWSMRWRTCAAGARWAGPGTRTGAWRTRRNTFSDFIACARHLVTEGIARPDALAGRGGSAGGLLIGAVANEAPELFTALVAQVPFVDVLTTMLDADLPLTVGEWEEWGNPLADEAAYERMFSYSPYDNVTAHNPDGSSRTYPSLLVTAGLNDPRVSYWEPAKWVAKISRPLTLDQGLAAHRNGRRPWRPLGALRRLEGGGAGLRVPARRPGHAALDIGGCPRRREPVPPGLFSPSPRRP